MTLEISMWLIYTGILGRREIHTTACPCTCHHHSQKDLWGSWMSSTTQVNTEVGRVSFSFFYFQLKDLLKELPVLFSSSSQCIKSWGCIFAPLFCCRRGPAASTLFSPWAGKRLSLLHLPAPLGDWRMKLCSWDLNIQFATHNLCRVIPSWSSSAWSTWNTSTNRSCHVKNEMEGDSNCGLYN